MPGMAKSRVPSPRDVVKVRRQKPVDHSVSPEERRLPAEGDTLQLAATVTRVDPHDHDTRWDKVTVRIPGYPIPVTLHLSDVYGDQE